MKIYCACNGKKCSGVCRKKHLYRPRKHFKRCPAAYDVNENGKEIRKEE